MNAFTVHPEQARLAMRRLMTLPDVQHIVAIDAMGLCLAHVGHEPVSNRLLSDWTVVARATFSSIEQMGKRSGAGLCSEALHTHADGGILMRAIAGGMLLVIHYGGRCPVDELRPMAAEVAQALPTAVEIKRTSRPLTEPAQLATAEHPFRPTGGSCLIHEAEIL